MYLNEIRLYGFKSFPDPINLKLNRGITGFVGPNGSGKSNVVDAIRWVLGEQSSKELRASIMDDLIFNGTYKRKPSNLSDVSLKFVNEGELELDFSEIEFERKLYRTGESQYLINRESVRLKDVQKLLLEAGMGVKSYSLFKRSLIDEIVGGRADALRNLFEESAGISQYKVAKKESLRKLIHTQEDLYRVDDLIAEIEKQHRDLKRQANRANRYNKYKLIVENLTQYVLKQRILKFDEKIEQIDSKINAKEERINVIVKDLENTKQQLTGHKIKRRECSDKLNSAIARKEEMQEKFYSVVSDIRIMEEQIGHSKENIELIEQNRERLIKEKPIREERLTQYRNRTEALNNKLKKLQSEMDSDDDSIETIYREKEKGFNALKDERRNKRNKKLILESEIANLKYKSENLSEQAKEKNEEMNLEMEGLKRKESELEKSREEHISLREGIEVLIKEHENLQNTIIEKTGHRNSLQNRLDEQREKIIENNAYIKHIVERMNETGSSIDKLREGVNRELTLIRNQITANGDYEKYVKCALSYFINAVEILPEEVNAIINTDSGIVSFIIGNNSVKRKEHSNSLDKHIDAPEHIKDILSHFIIVSDNDIYNMDDNAYYISESGIMKTPSGIFVKSGETEILNFEQSIEERKEENGQLEKSIAELTGQLDAVNNEIEMNNRERDLLLKKITENEQKIEFAQKSIEAIQSGIDARKGLIEKFRLLSERINNEMNTITQKIESNQKTINNIQSEMEEEEHVLIQHEDDYNKVKEDYIIYNNRKNQLEQMIRESKNELDMLRSEISSLAQSIENADREVKESFSKTDKLNKFIAENEASIEEKTSKQNELRAELLKFSEEVKTLENKMSDIDIKIDEAQESEEQKQNLLDTLREEKSSLKVEREKYTTEKDIDKQHVDEDFDIDYELIEKFRESAEEELTFLKDKMIRMEPINQLAFQEFQEVSERLDDMNSQKNDIIQAKENLEKTIKTLDAKAKTIFVQYFDTIKTNFRDLFYDIFKSGHADIVLEDEHAPLDSEIQIIFEPREKKVDKLVMLSDGERAMMVICLLFSMYMVRPTPVCIMDEIDGPLDDANVENFIELLKRFQTKTQFILITHNKRTMEFCDYLFGVTMEESGVTNIVSLNLQTISNKFLKTDVQ